MFDRRRIAGAHLRERKDDVGEVVAMTRALVEMEVKGRSVLSSSLAAQIPSRCETLVVPMSTILFDSIFQVKQVNKDGKYFDRGASP